MFNINIRAMVFRRTTCEPETCHEQIVLHLSPIYYLPPISVGTCASALRLVLSVALALAVRCAALCPAVAMYGDGAARLGSRADCQRPAERSECSPHARAGTDGGRGVREALGRKQWLLHDTPVSMLMAMAAAAPTVVLMKLTNSLVSHGQPSLPCAVAPMSDST